MISKELQNEIREILLLKSARQATPDQEARLHDFMLSDVDARGYVVCMMHQLAIMESSFGGQKDALNKNLVSVNEISASEGTDQAQQCNISADSTKPALPLPESIASPFTFDLSSPVIGQLTRSLFWIPLFVGVIFGAVALWMAGVLVNREAETPIAKQSDPDSLVQSSRKNINDKNTASSFDSKGNRFLGTAYLTAAHGCDPGHSDSTQFWNVGRVVGPGDEVILHEGIAEFRLAKTGVNLSIEGPVNFLMTSSDSLALQQGKVTAQVPWNPNGFQLLAGGCRITAIESDFGVQVSGDKTKVHVFSGKVTVIPSPFIDATDHELKEIGAEEDGSTTPIEITRGEAVEFKNDPDGSKVSRRFEADQEQFAAKLSMTGQLPITANYIGAVKKSRPVGYWRFEKVEENKTIRNEITDGCPLNVTTDISLTGDEKNHVVDLGQSFKRGNLVSAEPINSLSKANYSIELWAKPSHYHRGFLVAFAELMPASTVITSERQSDLGGKVFERNAFRLEVQRDYGNKYPGTIAASSRNPLGVNSAGCVSNELYHLRRWQHIVVVKGMSGINLYLNGKLVAWAKGGKTMLPDMYMVVGRPYPSFNDIPFVGQLDELSVYDRALTAEEVIKHYKAVEEANRFPPEI